MEHKVSHSWKKLLLLFLLLCLIKWMLVEGSYSLQMTERPTAILGGFTVECASLATLKSMNPVVGPIKFLPQPVQAKKKRTFTAKLFVVQSRGLCCLNFTCANCAPVQVWACGRGCFLKHKTEMLPISQTAWYFCSPLSASSKLKPGTVSNRLWRLCIHWMHSHE